MYNISIKTNTRDNLPRIEVKIANKEVYALLDTGANRCCISNKIANECNLKIKQSKTTLKLAQGYSNITNTADVEIYIPKVKVYIETEALVLYDSHEDIILGISEIGKLYIDINTIFGSRYTSCTKIEQNIFLFFFTLLKLK
ncbi:hypothetical protein BDAP_000596 [Binucleata daphniae]